MPGKPGSGGPVPKRSDQRRRTNKPEVPIIQAAAGAPVVPEPPEPDGAWHALAHEWFKSLGESGQAQFFEASDWAQAKVWADLLSRELFKDKPSAMMIAAWSSGAAELLTTEGSRRRMRIELARGSGVDPGSEHGDATVTDIKSRIGG